MFIIIMLSFIMASEVQSLDTNSTSLSEDSLNISFENITYIAKSIVSRSRKTILNDVSGQFNAGELSVIIGQSGAGKSTLMDILSGYTKPTSGNIYVNGRLRNLKKFKRRSCYILQDDKIQDMLTVQESLEISAEFKLGNHISREMKNRRIEEILTSLSLEEARHTRAIHLSGGQKKRLAIGLDLISDPPVMFLDEPASGLDSAKAEQLMYMLHMLARQGRTVVVTMHQPSALMMKLVDRVYAVVAGQCAYMGSEQSLLPYLEEMNLICPKFHNKIDFLIEICEENMAKLVEKSQNGKNTQWIANITQETENLDQTNFIARDAVFLSMLPPPKEDPTSKILLALKSTYATSRWKQFITLTKRSLLTMFRDPTLTIMLLSIHGLMAIFVGLLFYNIGKKAEDARDNYNFLYYSLMFLMFTAFSSVTIHFPLQIPIVRREHFNRWYTTAAYYSSQLVSTLPTQVVCTMTYAVIVYLLTGQPYESLRFTLFSVTLLMVSFTALCLGFLNGCMFDVKAGVIFGPLFIMPFTIFSGFFLHYTDAPTVFKWVFHISFLKHGLDGLIMSIFGMDRPKLPCTADYCHYRIPKQLMKDNGVIEDDFSTVVMSLIAITTVIITCSFIILKIRLKNKW